MDFFSFYRCKRFRQKSNLTVHVKRMHTPKGPDWKPLTPRAPPESTKKCNVCNKVLIVYVIIQRGNW